MTSPGLLSYFCLPSVLRRRWPSGPTLMFSRALPRRSVPSVAVRCPSVSPSACPASACWRGAVMLSRAPVFGRPPAAFPPELLHHRSPRIPWLTNDTQHQTWEFLGSDSSFRLSHRSRPYRQCTSTFPPGLCIRVE